VLPKQKCVDFEILLQSWYLYDCYNLKQVAINNIKISIKKLTKIPKRNYVIIKCLNYLLIIKTTAL